MQELISFKKILPGFNFGVNFHQNIQGFKFAKKKKKKMWCTCFSRHMTTTYAFWLNINSRWKTICFFMIFVWIYFLWILLGLNFANLIRFKKTQKIKACKNLYKWSICLNAIYDTLFRALILSLYFSDFLIGSFSTARQNS